MGSEDTWETAAVVADTLSAHALLGRLQSEGIAARVQADTALLGAVRQCRIQVPSAELRRARCALWLASFSDDELASLALADSAAAPGGLPE
ncbi:MAG TPA: hypothetical protein VME21_06380 [Steroidobacteraceae bacterium]|nr:hypothetical protein [Steroidobacteraceae bacterium]